jgi:hypothetical protein
MFGRRAKQIAELDAEVERLSAEAAHALEALARVQADYDAVMERVFKERRRFRKWEQEHATPRRGWALAREAVDLIRYGPMFSSSNPAAPSYSSEQVESGMRRIAAELERGDVPR